MPRILIADDQADVLAALSLLLKGERFQIESASSPEGVLRTIDTHEFDVVLIDLNYARDTTSGSEGLGPADAHSRRGSDASGRGDDGVGQRRSRGRSNASRRARLHSKAVGQRAPPGSVAYAGRARRSVAARGGVWKPKTWRCATVFPKLRVICRRSLAESPAMKSVLNLVERIGPADANVLITGENGTGKEVITRVLHSISSRRSKPLISLNAGALAEGVFESELFGHVRGAFTDAKSDRVGRFELADGGTLFLDEIGNVPLNLQAKLLRVLETGEFERVGSSKTQKVNVRLLSATNADLHAEVAQGRFRQDLLFRLNTVEIRLPPLRDRIEDIPILAEHFLKLHRERYRRPIMGFTPEALDALRQHLWPGNVRELDHVIERAVLMSTGNIVTAFDLALEATPDARLSARLEEMSLEDAERLLIKKALARFEGNANRAAEALGLSRSALYRRLQKYGLGS